MPQQPLFTSSTTTQVTSRIGSPSIVTMASVSLRIISCFWASEKTPSISLTWTRGIGNSPRLPGRDTTEPFGRSLRAPSADIGATGRAIPCLRECPSPLFREADWNGDTEFRTARRHERSEVALEDSSARRVEYADVEHLVAELSRVGDQHAVRGDPPHVILG